MIFYTKERDTEREREKERNKERKKEREKEKKKSTTLKSKLKQYRAPRGHNPLTFGSLKERNGSQEHNSCIIKYKEISDTI